MDLVAVLLDASRAALGVPAAAYALAAIGLNLHFGYTGLLNFGHIAFLLVGAYGTAITVDAGGPLWLGVAVGVLAAVVLGLVMGLPTLRLRADYLAIVTIALGEILRLLFRSRPMQPLTGGVRGMEGYADAFYAANPYTAGARYGVGALTFSGNTLWVMTVGWGLVVLATLLLLLLVRSPWGRVLRSIREDEDAARSLGKNVFGYKLQSLVLGGVLGALAGIVLALDRQYVNPDFYLVVFTFFFYTIVILGGPGTLAGPIVGSVLFWFIIQGTESLLRQAINQGYLGGLIDTTDLGAVRLILAGTALVLLMVFRPQGIFGNRRELLLDER